MNNRFPTLLPPSVQVFHRALPKNLRYGFSACLDNDNRLKKKQGRTDTSSRPKKAISTSGKRDSNSRPRPWQGRALPTELLPHLTSSFHQRARLCRGDRIRTCGRLVPNQERYRAALHPVAILK